MRTTKKLWHPHAHHILQAIQKIERYQSRGGLNDEMAYDAILRNLATLSESADCLPHEIKQHYSDIAWRDVKGFRNHLIHEYLGEKIDPAIIAQFIKI